MTSYFRKMAFNLTREVNGVRKFSKPAAMIRSEALSYDITVSKQHSWNVYDAVLTVFNFSKVRSDHVLERVISSLLPFVVSFIKSNGGIRYTVERKIDATLKETLALRFTTDLRLKVIRGTGPLKRKFATLQGKKLVSLGSDNFKTDKEFIDYCLSMAKRLSNSSTNRRTVVLGFGDITPSITGKEVALLASSIGSLQSPSQFNTHYSDLLHEVYRQCIPLSVDDTCMILWAAAKMASTSTNIQQLLDDAVKKIQQSNSNKYIIGGQCARLVWCSASLSLDIAFLLNAFEKHLTTAKLSVKHIANVLWSMAKVRVTHPTISAHILNPSTVRMNEGLTPSGFATCVWAVAVLSVPSAAKSLDFFMKYLQNYNKSPSKVVKRPLLSDTKVLGAIFFSHGHINIKLPEWVVDNTLALLNEGSGTNDFITQVTSYLSAVNNPSTPGIIPKRLLPVAANILGHHWERLTFKTIGSCLYFSACYDLQPSSNINAILDRLANELDLDSKEAPENQIPLNVVSQAVWSVTALRVRHVDFYQEAARTAISRGSQLRVIDGAQLLWCFHTIGARLDQELLDTLLNPFLQFPREANMLDVLVLSFTLMYESQQVTSTVINALVTRIYELHKNLTPDTALTLSQYLTKIGLNEGHDLLSLLRQKAAVNGTTAYKELVHHSEPYLGSFRPQSPARTSNKRAKPRPVAAPYQIANFPFPDKPDFKKAQLMSMNMPAF
eukprot:TRINITY_DN20948_c0_g1_i1.p1 TRINITY_DN20948_c0_g1~~TRINITY_DN20948_c0_g1_i1.p1  ORF type:complete len:723 (+),score=89.70 TRINITY_DN20948_c0_g1_i1:98-2266(+)